MNAPRFFTVNDRPVKTVHFPDGRMGVFALNVRTGRWEPAEQYLDQLASHYADAEFLDEPGFMARVDAVRSRISSAKDADSGSRFSSRFGEALEFSFALHRDQVRKGSGIPYFAHLLAVSALALKHGADEDQAIAALLHDAAEDHGGEPLLDEIGSRFGGKVVEMVRACTDALEEPKPPWKERKVRYLAHLASAPAEAQLVSACDKLHNLRAIVADYRKVGEALWDRFSGGREGVLWYYRELAAVFPAGNPARPELRRVLAELEALLPLP